MLRYLLCVCLVLAGCASTNQSAYIDQPVRVTGEGRTFEEAKQNAFSNAIEYAVGAVVVSETQVQNKRLVKDDILKHSSGYIDDYKVISRVDESNRVTVVMDVKVKNSIISERITNVKTSSNQLQGERMGETYSSFMQTKETGDRLLKKVLDDFPKKALNVEQREVEYLVNINRQPVIAVHYTVRYNHKYIEALNEALTLTQDPKDRNLRQKRIDVQYKPPNAWFIGKTDVYYFNDEIRSGMIIQALRRAFYLHMTFRDKDGQILKRSCGPAHLINGVYQTGAFVVEGNEEIRAVDEVTIKVNADKIRRISNIELTIEPRECTFIN